MPQSGRENRKEKRGKRERENTIPSGTVFNEEITQEELGRTFPLRQCNNLAETSNDESSDEKYDHTCKICKILWIELKRNVETGFNAIYALNKSAQKAMTSEIFPQIMIFCSI